MRNWRFSFYSLGTLMLLGKFTLQGQCLASKHANINYGVFLRDGLDREWSHWVHWWFDFDRGSCEIIPLTIQHSTPIDHHHWGGIKHTMMRWQEKTSMMQMSNKSSVDEHLDFEQHVQDIARRSDQFSSHAWGLRRHRWILSVHDMSSVLSTPMT